MRFDFRKTTWRLFGVMTNGILISVQEMSGLRPFRCLNIMKQLKFPHFPAGDCRLALPFGHSPFAVNSGDILDKEHSIFNLIILPAGETEKARIIEENKNLLERLAAYKPYFKIDMKPGTSEHHHSS